MAFDQRKYDIGKFDRRVEIWSTTPSNRIANNESLDRADSTTKVWAMYEPVRALERYNADELQTYTEAKFTIRYYKEINEDWGLFYNNKSYDIISITPIGREQYLELLCSSTSITKFKT